MSYIIIDARALDEYAIGHVEGAINIPPAQLMNGAPELTGIPQDGCRANQVKPTLKSSHIPPTPSLVDNS